MKVLLPFLMIVFFYHSGFSQKQGIGIRLGDPVGITYKQYLLHDRAVEFGLGSAAPGWHHGYYRNSFESRDAYQDYRYTSHRVQSILFLQGRYLLHNDIYVQNMEGKWDWYWGVGAMLKVAKVSYKYQDIDPPFDSSDDYSDIDFGPEGIIGMEYTFQDVPVSVFGEVSLLLELVNRLTLQPYGGVGARYNF